MIIHLLKLPEKIPVGCDFNVLFLDIKKNKNGELVYEPKNLDLFKIDFLANHSKTSKKPGILSFFTWLDQYI